MWLYRVSVPLAVVDEPFEFATWTGEHSSTADRTTRDLAFEEKAFAVPVDEFDGLGHRWSVQLIAPGRSFPSMSIRGRN